MTANVYICSDEEYQMVHDKLASSQLVTDSEDGSYYVKDGKIRGTIDADQDGTLLFSLPYDTGWKVKVDGKTVETYAVGRSLLGIDLTEGSHEIALDYTAPGLWEGRRGAGRKTGFRRIIFMAPRKTSGCFSKLRA